jgi:hypothetical protein
MPAGYATLWPYRFCSRFNSPLLRITFLYSLSRTKMYNNHHHSDYAYLLNLCPAKRNRLRD